MTQLDVRSAMQADVAAPPPALSDDPTLSGRTRWLLVLLVVAVVSLVAVWMISPRFEIVTPSVVDDWAALFHSSDQISQVLRFENPESNRFRPGVIAWTYVQWHTFDAPQGLAGPNAWNVLRVLVLVAGLSLLTALAIPFRRGRLDAVLYAALVGIPAFVVVMVPKFARDLARFGPQEPLLVGGMALGGSLLLLAGKSLLSESRQLHSWRILGLGVVGSVAWMMGVYQKETSVCVVPLLAAVLFVARSRLAGWRRLSTGRKSGLAAIAAVVALPVAHVAIETFRIVRRGDLVYDAQVSGGRGLVRGVRDLYGWAHEALPPNARLLVYGAVLLTIAATVVRRKVDPIAVGALVSGALSFLFAGQSGVLATRYYIPICALFAVAFALSLARFPAPVQLAGVLAVFLAFIPPPGTREEVQRWTDEELGNQELVLEVARLESSGCLVAAAGLDLETSFALPVLIGLEHEGRASACDDADAYLVVGPGEEGTALASSCVPDTLEQLREAPVGAVYRCDRLRAEPVRDPTLGLIEPDELVAQRRLQPALLG